MQKRILKWFVLLCGFIPGFHSPVVAQYGAPENLYFNRKIQEQKEIWKLPVADSNCDMFYFIENQKDTDLATPALSFQPVTESPPENAFDIRLFPNPCSSEIRIISEGTEQQEFTLDIFNMRGELLATYHLKFNAGEIRELNMGKYPKGTYLLVFTTANGTTIKRKVIKNQ